MLPSKLIVRYSCGSQAADGALSLPFAQLAADRRAEPALIGPVCLQSDLWRHCEVYPFFPTSVC